MGLILGSLSFGSAVGQAPKGIISDRYDRRYILPTGIGLSGLAVLAFSLTPGAGMADVTISGVHMNGTVLTMMIAMFAIGTGSSTVRPTGYPLITANVRDHQKGRVLGIWGGPRRSSGMAWLQPSSGP